jgi:hypothetical protein
MARRFDDPSKQQLSARELAELRTRLAAMPLRELETYYKASLNACQYVMRLPSARLIQEMVTAWKALRKRRG